MLDIAFIRDNAELVKTAVKNKLLNVDIDKLLELDINLRKQITAINEKRSLRNSISKDMPKLDAEKKAEALETVKKIKEELPVLEKAYESEKEEYDQLMLQVPSVPMPEVPVGSREEDNLEIRRVGSIPEFDFMPKDHIELAEALDIVEIPRAVKFAGSRSYILKNEGALLEMGICRMVIDMLFARGFSPCTMPMLVKESAMTGTGYFPAGFDQAYKIPEDERYLAGTSEVPLVSMHQDEILDLKMLPIKYAGYSTCYRREAGTYGKDTRGLYRVHQFQKVEQVVFCENNEEIALKHHLEILNNTEDVLKNLELPYRVALACTGEIGIGQTRKHEVESWMPSRNAYCETHSCSTLGEFQARRSNIRYRDKDGTVRFVYTLNNTGIATPRILIPFLEIHQQKDGSVVIPKALRPYMNNMEVITPKK